ncbi:MAG: MFS transporter [Deltaproteobacteria bacterium]|nr:MFS transporter [Deltaproteobacteria bacterium]
MGTLLSRLFAGLRYRNYRLYWLGQLSSVLALNMEMAAQAWLVFLLTDSPLMLGVAGIVYAVPRVSLVLVGGAIADRADKRRIMVCTQSLLALAYLVLGLLILTERIMFWHVLVFAFNSGLMRSFDRPSRYALLPEMVPREEIANAVALGSSVWQACRLVGPGLAGLLIHWFGVGHTFIACFVSSAAAVALWAFIRTRPLIGQPEGGVWRNILAGLHFVRHNQLFYSLLGLTCFNSLFGMSYVILLPVFARTILEVDSRGFGLLQSFSGVGALIGTLIVAYLAQAGRRGWQVLVGSAIFGSLLMLFAYSSSFALSLGLIFVLGLFNQIYLTSINTILQLNLPNELRGRVLGLFGLTWDLMPLGGAISGTVAEFAGAPTAVAMGGFLVAALGLYGLARLPAVREIE